MNKSNEKKILWYNLAFMAFSTVWGFGNVINGFSEYGGLKAIVSWIILFALYFIPYALMVGELGSTFKNEGGGVSSWIHETIGPGMAYMAGWTYWVVHMPYISQKPNSSVIAASWAFFRDSRASGMNTRIMAVICLVLFLFFNGSGAEPDDGDNGYGHVDREEHPPSESEGRNGLGCSPHGYVRSEE